MNDATESRPGIRERIVDAAAQLLREEGPSAVTTRAVAVAAGVQPPAIYRLFGDKDGLLEAVAEHVMTTYVEAKAGIVDAAAADGVDPLDDLRAGWETQLEFGLANPDVFRLLSEPGRVLHSPSAAAGRRVLEKRIRRVAESGRLRVSEQRALGLVQAGGVGTVQTLLATPVEQRDPGLGEAMYQAVLAQILTDAPVREPDDTVAATVAFRAIAPSLSALTASERLLMTDWLDRALAAE
ncbi:TetR/AcrR family transcriptional regulator [Herbiconiux sp. UC225_62]|uniref:TetR/AcrR family transcriptional regulator n=1 Tax=Herbiconiux sp. UC225_62 TaxID=3350168 RepID=UPI0036D35835